MFQGLNVKSGYFHLLSADQLFRDLTPKSLALLGKLKQTKNFRKGTCLFSRGDPARGIYLLRKGQAQLVFGDEAKDMPAACLIAPNELFGLTESFADLPYETRAETITACLCDFFEREDFIRFLQAEPQICFRLAQLLAASLQKNFRLFSSKIR